VSTSRNTILTRLNTIFTRLNIMLTRLNTIFTRLNTIFVDRTSSIPQPVPLLHCIVKSEPQLSYDALFRSLCFVAERLENPNVHICAVWTDHCEAIQNAAQAGGTVGPVICVVDCIVHVERNMIIRAQHHEEKEDEDEDEEEEGEETKGHKKEEEDDDEEERKRKRKRRRRKRKKRKKKEKEKEESPPPIS
jgi:hypothetical protein